MNTKSHNQKLVLPPAFLFLRVAQIILALIVLGLTAYLISNTFYGLLVPSSYGLAMFTSIATLIIVVYNLVAERAVPAIYNVWAILALEIFSVIFWLSTMGSIAAFRSGFYVYSYDYDYDYRRDLDKREYLSTTVYLGVLIGVAVVSAKEMILFLISLAIFGTRLYRLQKSNSPAVQTQPQQFQPQYEQAQVQPQPSQPQYQPQYQQGQMPPQQQYQQAPAQQY